MHKLIISILFTLHISIALTQDNAVNSFSPAERWADSILQTLTTEEMIAQLMVVRANTPNQDYYTVIDQYISKYNIGGVTFFGGHPSLRPCRLGKAVDIPEFLDSQVACAQGRGSF